MIIIEGCDRVGKTTFAKRLCQDLDYKYFHLGPPEADFDFYWDFHKLIKANHILDRFHISEWAYAYARNEPARMSELQKQLVDAALIQNSVTSVLITTDWNHISDRWTPEELYDLETTKKAWQYFRVNQRQFDIVIDASPFPTNEQLEVVKSYHVAKIKEVLRIISVKT